MKLNKKIVILLLLSFICAAQMQAQVFDDWEARPNISLRYKINKQWTIAGTYYLYLDHNMKQYDKSVISTEIGYKVNSWLKIGVDHRYGMNQKEHYHDIRYAVTFDYNPFRKWKIAYRPMLQQGFTSLTKEKLAEDPVKYYLRNRLTLSYEPSGYVELYVFTENYLKPVDGDFIFHRQKSAVGVDFDISKRSRIGARFEVINKKSGKTIARPNLSYTYTLGYIKKNK